MAISRFAELKTNDRLLYYRLKLGLTGVGVALGAGFLYLVNPATLPPSCLFHSMTGWNCPFCGATRATHQLLHGDLMTALHLNALFVLSLPLLAWLGWSYLRTTWAGQEWRGYRLKLPQTTVVCVLLLLFAVLRNLPFAPFN